MKKIKSVLIFIIASAIFCSCGATEIPPENPSSENQSSESSSAAEAITESGFSASPYDTVTDLGGNKINYLEDVTSFTVDYALCWDLYSEGYRKLDSNKKWFGYSMTASSTFEVINYPNDFAVCTHSSVYLYPDGVGDSPKIKGVFVYDGEYVRFYPYYGEDNSEKFFFLHSRSEYSEEALREKENLAFSDGTTVRVQPIGIICQYKDENGQQAPLAFLENFEEYIGINLPEDFEYIEATVCFNGINFIGSSNANDTPVNKTNITGTVREIVLSQ